MPILKVKVSDTKSPDTTRAISAMLLELTTRILGKKPELTAIVVEYVDPADWVVGGRTLLEQGKRSFHFDIKIVDESNTRQQKAQYIREAFDGFAGLLGELHEESYIHIDDVRASAYGFGGKTQEARFHLP
ncbi:4-oxalocrotonate tautomerase [Luteimonas viscosa]|uniref:4-oxalocrotonate tautomerase n=1 Tax=Luteimonas viscosa TaxID=1132694 RepID=A0A5D4XQM9_9GAMM|nr:tautomerase family protein [Luteimonas viscosa]TYT26977.1 4-oxalocrotonate tautomerase [Luteimonas viscosa]